MDSETIDWDMTGTLTATRIINAPHSSPPDFTGTLRSCVRTAMAWPPDADPNIFLDGRVIGKTALGRGEIVTLSKILTG